MSYRFLIVDDSQLVRKALTKTLNLSGLPIGDILEAGHGADALMVLDHEDVDVVFLDINMPVMNGIEFLQHLREREDCGDLPVIIISTEGSDGRREELTSLGITAYLRKPCPPEKIAETVESLFEGNKQ